jgi:hypothetical protein
VPRAAQADFEDDDFVVKRKLPLPLSTPRVVQESRSVRDELLAEIKEISAAKSLCLTRRRSVSASVHAFPLQGILARVAQTPFSDRSQFIEPICSLLSARHLALLECCAPGISCDMTLPPPDRPYYTETNVRVESSLPELPSKAQHRDAFSLLSELDEVSPVKLSRRVKPVGKRKSIRESPEPDIVAFSTSHGAPDKYVYAETPNLDPTFSAPLSQARQSASYKNGTSSFSDRHHASSGSVERQSRDKTIVFVPDTLAFSPEHEDHPVSVNTGVSRFDVSAKKHDIQSPYFARPLDAVPPSTGLSADELASH